MTLFVCVISGILAFSVCHAQQKRSEEPFSETGIKIIPCRHLFNISGTKEKPFNQPSAVTVFKDQIMVLDGVNSRVAVFDLDGTFRFQFARLIARRASLAARACL